MVNVKKETFKSLHYLIYYPKDYQKGKKYPLVLHLHGAGSRGTNFEEFKGSTILDILEKEDSPLSNAICVFPQCHADSWFDIFGDLLDFVKHLYERDDIDQGKFNGSGISMGGYAIYQVMISIPEYFHKAIVCCGGGMYWDAFRMKNIKLRIFHGEKDNAVFPEESRRMYARLKEANADVVLTIYPDRDHNCWDPTYSNYENLDWLVN